VWWKTETRKVSITTWRGHPLCTVLEIETAAFQLYKQYISLGCTKFQSLALHRVCFETVIHLLKERVKVMFVMTTM
jgi:hypothetical protein